MTFRLDGKIAIITAAGQGMGAATARVMAGVGATVVVAGRNEEGVKKVAAGIVASGGKASGMYFDALQEKTVQALIQETHKKYGRIDILHNNAGGTWPERDGQATDISQKDWDDIFAWNMNSIFWACKYAAPLMIAGGGGSIINTLSVGADFAMSNQAAYGAAKAAAASFTRYMAVQYGRRNLRCNAVSPGLILTPHAIEKIPEAYMNAIVTQITTPRVGGPDDIAHAVAFLASDVSSYINGQILTIDGGVSARLPHDAAVLDMQGYGPGVPTSPLPKMP